MADPCYTIGDCLEPQLHQRAHVSFVVARGCLVHLSQGLRTAHKNELARVAPPIWDRPATVSLDYNVFQAGGHALMVYAT